MWKSKKLLALFLVSVLVLQSAMAWPSREQAIEPAPVLVEEPVAEPLEEPMETVVETAIEEPQVQEPSQGEILLSLENEQLKKDIEELKKSLKESEGKRLSEALTSSLENQIDTVFLGAQIMSAGHEDLKTEYSKLESEYNALAKEYSSATKKNKLAVEILPKATYTIGKNIWGAGIDIGFSVDNIVIEAGVEKKIRGWDSFTSPDDYTVSLGVGYRF